MQTKPTVAIRNSQRGPTTPAVLLALACWLGGGAAAGCGLSLQSGERPLHFPDALLAADLGPPRAPKGSADPFGWLGDAAAPAAVAQASASEAQIAAPSAPERSLGTASSPGLRLATSGFAGEAYDPASAAGYVEAVYALNGVSLSAAGDGAAPTLVELYQHAYRRGVVYHSSTPAVGDIVFFHNTFDRNGDGRWNDWYTWAAVVESVSADGEVACIGFVDGAVQRVKMSTEEPSEAARNTVLRLDAPGSSGLAGKLFAGYANLLGDATKVTVVDNWQPGMRLQAGEATAEL